MTSITLELYSLKELVVLRKVIQERMNYLEAVESTLHYSRENTIDYLTLGQIFVRLPDPSLITPQPCIWDDMLP